MKHITHNTIGLINLTVGLIILFFVLSPFQVLALIPNDPQYSNQWYLDSISAPLAWEKTTGSRSVVVAVLDTGVEFIHPDLTDNIWINPKEVAFNNIDDDGNGFVDDVYGWDFVGNQSNPGPDLNLPQTSVGLHHGTVVAGIIGAVGNNGTDGAGVNWQVKIMPLKVLDEKGEGDAGTVVKAIDYAITQKADIINLSFIGVSPGENLLRAIQRAALANIVLVAAAGNDDNDFAGGDLDFNPRYPACYDGPNGEPWWVIGVAALDRRDQKAVFSDYGFKCVDIAAPGVEMSATMVFHPNRPELQKSFDGRWSGTSLAAPLVAGAAALIKSLRPEFGSKEIYDILTKSADNIDLKNVLYLKQLGAGKLNLARAVSIIDTLYPKPVKISPPELLVYRLIKNDQKVLFYSISGQPADYVGEAKVYSRQDLPKKVLRAYNKYKGNLAITFGDIDNDGEIETIVVKPARNPVAVVWSQNGIKKKEIKIKGDYRSGLGILIK